jgi:serine/threonine protein kinase
LREYSALKRVAELDRAPRVDPYFTDGNGGFWVVPLSLPQGRTIRALQVAGEKPQAPAQLAADAFTGLADLHEAGVVHRAISPDTVWIGDDGRVRFDGFHMARIAGERSLAGSLESIEETDPYAAPELRLGMGFAEPASDIFSLALTLRYAFTGEEPNGGSATDSSIAPHFVAHELLALLRVCLASDDRTRPPANSIAARLRALEEQPSGETADPLAEGALIDDQYRVLRILGRGASGVTVLANDEIAGGSVVLKAISNPELKLLLARAEFRALRDLAHPSLPRVLDIRPPAAPFQIKLEFVAGDTLAEQRRAGRPKVEIAKRVLRALSELLKHLEDRNYLHRDITPHNIVVPDSPDEPVRLIDFGLAAAMGEDSALVGTPLYRAPEIDAGLEWTPLADQYALATVLIEFLAGKLPYQLEGRIPRKRQRLPLSALIGSSVSADIVRILERASHPEPAARYPTNSDFAHEVLKLSDATPDATAPQDPIDVQADVVESVPGLGSPGACYELDPESVQHGGTADVYRAARSGVNEPVALKLLRGTADQPRLIQLSFERELGALRRLDHPHVVELVDAGKDTRSGEYFLVLEWLPLPLDRHLEAQPALRDWQLFGRQIALPIASALAYAHEQHVVHRDVKPSNILIAETGPKLADFGIAVLRTAIPTDGDTLAEFMSRPFAPPERSSASEYDRDVFGWGVTVIACLTDQAVEDYPDLEPALRSLPVPDPVRELLGRCISFDPGQRPRNGLVLIAELERLLRAAPEADAKEVPAGITSHRLRSDLSALATAEAISVEEFVERDLSSQPFARTTVTEEGERHLFLYGQRWSYRCSVSLNRSQLSIFSGREESVAQLDMRRESAAVLPFAIKTTGAASPTGRANLEALLDYVEHAEDRRLDELYERDERRLLTSWHNQLRALEGLEAEREDPISYRGGRVEGRRFFCTLVADHPDDLVGQQRLPALSDRRFRQFSGTVEQHRDRQVVLLLARTPNSDPPKSGSLLLDTAGAAAALRRQRDALNAVRFKSPLLARSDLPELIMHPERTAEPVAMAVDAWAQEGLTSDKQRAVRLALGSRDFFAVKGPPGTGKTTLIAELVVQELRRNPDARILITSQTNVALDNALERLTKVAPGGIRMVRLSNALDARVDPSVQHLLLEAQMASWRKDVRRKSERYLERRLDDRGVDIVALQVRLDADALIQLRDDEEGTKEDSTEVGHQGVSDVGDHEGRRAVVERRQRREQLEGRLATSLKMSRSRVQKESAGSLREAAEALFGSSPASSTDKALFELQREWVSQVAARGPQFEEPLLFGSQVIAATCVGLAGFRAARDLAFDLCILDEASKASATESLVPIVRSQRWVMVGDENQLGPFEQHALLSDEVVDEYDLDAADLRRTLFERFQTLLPTANTTSLTTQHRSVRAVGDLIGSVFYGGALESVMDSGPLNLGIALPRPVTWFDTSKLPSHGERRAAGTSYANDAEAAEIAAFAERLAFTHGAARTGQKLELLTLSAYRPQVDLIRATLGPRHSRTSQLKIEANTVDAAQCREADVVAFSVTRSNDRGAPGFLTDRRRINVALSRARYGLAIFGDLDFCLRHDGPLRQVIQYVRDHPESCHIEVLG